MVAALELYCDLLAEPGVLNAPFRHYAGELRRVGAANRRLLEALSRLEELPRLEGTPLQAELPRQDNADASPSLPPRADRGPGAISPAVRLRARWQPDRKLPEQPLPAGQAREAAAPRTTATELTVSETTVSASQLPCGDSTVPHGPESLVRTRGRQALVSERKVQNLADELQANRNLLEAMVGRGVTLGISMRGGARPIAMSGDDLTRVLVNLARNAAEAMPGGGHLQIALEEGPEFLTLSFTDNGPGIPPHALESIFSPGYSTHLRLDLEQDSACAWPVQHRGLGLSIVRSLVAAAGGAVWAANRMADPAEPSSATPGSGGFGEEERCAGQGDSSPPHGAVFLVEFPLVSPDGSPPK